MAVMVDVTGDTSKSWLREWNSRPFPDDEFGHMVPHLGFELWAETYKTSGRPVKFIPQDYNRSLKQMIVECTDDADAVEFKLRWL